MNYNFHTIILILVCKKKKNPICIKYIYCFIPDIFYMYISVCMYSRWVNTLGMAAMQGIDVVLRHSFFDYGYTRLVDQLFNPLPVSLSVSIH